MIYIDGLPYCYTTLEYSPPPVKEFPRIDVREASGIVVSTYVPGDTVCTSMTVTTHFPNDIFLQTDSIPKGYNEIIVDLPPTQGVTYPQCIGDYLFELCIDDKVVDSTTYTYSDYNMIELPTMNARVDYANNQIIASCDVPEGANILVYTIKPSYIEGSMSWEVFENIGIGKTDVIFHLPSGTYEEIAGDYYIELCIAGVSYCCSWLTYSPEIK